jgi:hypothetical protein
MKMNPQSLRRPGAFVHYAPSEADVVSGISLLSGRQSGKSLLPECRTDLRQYHIVTKLRRSQERLMQDTIRTQMRQLCESIASEQDRVRFMELVTRLNELLQHGEANGPVLKEAPEAAT